MEEVALRSLQGNTSRAARPCSEPFSSGQVLVWAGQMGARPDSPKERGAQGQAWVVLTDVALAQP